MKRNLPIQIQDFLQAYSSRLSESLPDDLLGLYVYGSIALDAYDEKHSDIDAIALVKQPLSGAKIQRLSEMHADLSKEFAVAQKVDVVYIQQDDISKVNQEIQPYPYYNGTFYESGYWDLNHVTWWILKNHGITLVGPAPCELGITTAWEDIKANMAINLNNYWQKRIEKEEYLVGNLDDEEVVWAVLTLCRIFVSLEQSAIVSKVGGAEIAMRLLPERWKQIIREAIRIRRDEDGGSLYASLEERSTDVREFVLFIIGYCKTKFF